MKKSEIKVIIKFLNNQSNIEELEFLLDWIKDLDNYELFAQYISIHHFSNLAMNKADQESIIKEINKKIKSQRNKNNYLKIRVSKLSKYAAIIIMSFAVWVVKTVYLYFVGVVMFPSKSTKCNFRKLRQFQSPI